MTNYLIDDWAVSNYYSLYTAPELQLCCLIGYRSDVQKFIKTSPIKSANGRNITTASGTIYILGVIHPNYFEWLNKNNIQYNFNNPITIREKK